jgi:hypothetical protein
LQITPLGFFEFEFPVFGEFLVFALNFNFRVKFGFSPEFRFSPEISTFAENFGFRPNFGFRFKFEFLFENCFFIFSAKLNLFLGNQLFPRLGRRGLYLTAPRPSSVPLRSSSARLRE